MEAGNPADPRIAELMDSTEVISGMMNSGEIELVLTELERALEAGVPGDIVELGCNCGTTTIFIAKLLEQRNESREYHVYDSFTGLPESGPGDLGAAWPDLPPGSLAVDRAEFTQNLEQAGVLRPPNIHEGLFEDLGAADVPDEICWAFLDGDLYQSILLSLELVYPRLAPGGAMVLDDYGWDALPGVERACSDFPAAKPESATVFADANVAVVVKQPEGQAGG
jgi:O-methyltransferase